MTQLQEARQERVANPEDTIRRLAAAKKLNKRFTEEVVALHRLDGEETKFGVVNAFTTAAQSLPPLPRLEVERLAGSLLAARL